MEVVSSYSDDLKPPVYTEHQEALTLLVPMASTGLGGKPESAAFLSKHALGLSVVSRGEFHFRECSSQKLDLCHFLDGPYLGPSLAVEGWGDGASAHKAFSGPIGLLPEVEHVWSCFPALPMTCKAPVHWELEAAQTLLGAMASTGLREKPQAFLT